MLVIVTLRGLISTGDSMPLRQSPVALKSNRRQTVRVANYENTSCATNQVGGS